MRFWVANTDHAWFDYLSSLPSIDEVNFWQPNKVRPITLPVGSPLSDLGYLTDTPTDLRVRVSRRIHEEFENGQDYYALDGREVRLPRPAYPQPSREMLDWHSQVVFRG